MLGCLLQLFLIVWRIYQVKNRTMGVVKGIGAGLAAGAALGMIGSYAMHNQKGMKKKGKKAANAITDILDNVQYIFK